MLKSELECSNELQNKCIGIITEQCKRILKRITNFLCVSHLWNYFQQQLHQWFLSCRKLLESLQYLLPPHCISLDEEKTKDISDTPTNFWYLDADSYRGSLPAELALWMHSRNVAPKYFIMCLKQFDKNIFPNLHRFLKIGATIPSTTATRKRSS